MFYTLSDGRQLYLAWRSGSGKSSKGYFKNKNAWCIDKSTLRTCEDRGIKAVGIAWRNAGKIQYYLTNIEDFWNPPSEDHNLGDAPQRRLNRDRFLVNMVATKKGLIHAAESSMRLGR